MSIKTIDPELATVRELYLNLSSAIAPRPICFASTVDKNGNVNLSPFSFFNVFGSNPPTVIFSSARRVRDNTNKHTFHNVQEVGEVVINIVNYPIVEQMSLASTEYDKGVNEFVKSGLGQLPSVKVKPPRVLESPVSLECVVKQVIETGEEGGAGNLIICEVVMMHIDEEYLSEDGNLDSSKLDLVARMGGNWYCRASGDALFEIPKPIRSKGIGVDALPDHVRNSNVLTGNNLGRLGNIEKLPSKEEIIACRESDFYEDLIAVAETSEHSVHVAAKQKIERGEVKEALTLLLSV